MAALISVAEIGTSEEAISIISLTVSIICSSRFVRAADSVAEAEGLGTQTLFADATLK
jgi:hypothetical protein